jgi:23S rRNA pseudouridine1911/1915/1917 synthase
MKVKKEWVNNRLDQVLKDYLNESRSFITNHIKNGNILINDTKVKPGYLLKKDDDIFIGDLKIDTSINPEDIPLDIYYEDEYLMVVNKPSGMVVHPASGNYHGTLVNALMYHTKNLSDINGEMRPGIVHRIDKDTSGLLLISKTNEAHRILADDFKHKRVKRKYLALVHGIIDANNGKIDAPIGRSNVDRKKMSVTEKNSKKAITNFTVKERFKNYTLVELILETGRTHQIRVHMAYINHPVVNDQVYSKIKPINNYGQMLHAYYIGFTHPITKEFMEFECPLESEFVNIMESLKNS